MLKVVEAKDKGGRGVLKWEGHTRGKRDMASSPEKTQKVLHLIPLALGCNHELSGGRPQLLSANMLEILSSYFLRYAGR